MCIEGEWYLLRSSQERKEWREYVNQRVNELDPTFSMLYHFQLQSVSFPAVLWNQVIDDIHLKLLYNPGATFINRIRLTCHRTQIRAIINRIREEYGIPDKISLDDWTARSSVQVFHSAPLHIPALTIWYEISKRVRKFREIWLSNSDILKFLLLKGSWTNIYETYHSKGVLRLWFWSDVLMTVSPLYFTNDRDEFSSTQAIDCINSFSRYHIWLNGVRKDHYQSDLCEVAVLIEKRSWCNYNWLEKFCTSYRLTPAFIREIVVQNELGMRTMCMVGLGIELHRMVHEYSHYWSIRHDCQPWLIRSYCAWLVWYLLEFNEMPFIIPKYVFNNASEGMNSHTQAYVNYLESGANGQRGVVTLYNVLTNKEMKTDECVKQALDDMETRVKKVENDFITAFREFFRFKLEFVRLSWQNIHSFSLPVPCLQEDFVQCVSFEGRCVLNRAESWKRVLCDMNNDAFEKLLVVWLGHHPSITLLKNMYPVPVLSTHNKEYRRNCLVVPFFELPERMLKYLETVAESNVDT